MSPPATWRAREWPSTPPTERRRSLCLTRRRVLRRMSKEFPVLYDKDMDCPGYSTFFATVLGQGVADQLVGFPILLKAFAHEDVVEFGDTLAGKLLVTAFETLRGAKVRPPALPASLTPGVVTSAHVKSAPW
jgi:hypothetical protein